MVPDSFHTHTHRGVMSVNVRRLFQHPTVVILIKCVSHYYTHTHTLYFMHLLSGDDTPSSNLIHSIHFDMFENTK